MRSQSGSGKKHMIKITLTVMIVFVCFLSSCNTTENTTETTTQTTTDHTVENWIDSITDNGVYIGQDKEVVGCYKRIGIARIGGTYEDMLELRDVEKQGYLVANDDGTAFFELDGEKTEFVFDGAYFYLSDDTDRANGFRYACINGRLIIDDGTNITQYLRLTDEELAAYLE